MRVRMSGSMSSAMNRRMGSHQYAAHQIERLLAGPPPDAFAIAGKAALHDFMLVSIGDGDIDQANWLLFCATGWPGDAGNPQADVGIADFADILGQRQRDFLAHRTVRLDPQRWNVGKQRLQFVGVNHRSAEKETRTARHGRDSFRYH